MAKIGELGEKLVREWLNFQEVKILQHRWRSRWGEIDIIAQINADTIAFIEVKTRSLGNWDENGLLAVDRKKQSKLIKTAALFLSKYPQYADLICRFDVALVSYKNSQLVNNQALNKEIFLGEPVFWGNYQLTLQQYLESAFELDFN